MNQEKTLYELFRITIIVRAVGALGEMLAGVFVAYGAGQWLIVTVLTHAFGDEELGTSSYLANELLALSDWLTVNNELLVGVYLFLRGLIQVFLTYELFRNKMWAYPALLLVMASFVVTQTQSMFAAFSLATLLITLFDLLTMYLIWHEYRAVRALRAGGLVVQDTRPRAPRA